MVEGGGLHSRPWSGALSNAWIKDYKPSQRSGYVEAFLSNVDWSLCEGRLQTVSPEKPTNR